jgi:hypothetical protein
MGVKVRPQGEVKNGPLECLVLFLLPPFFPITYYLMVHLPVNQDDQQLIAHAIASDFQVTWQFSQSF